MDAQMEQKRAYLAAELNRPDRAMGGLAGASINGACDATVSVKGRDPGASSYGPSDWSLAAQLGELAGKYADGTHERALLHRAADRLRLLLSQAEGAEFEKAQMRHVAQGSEDRLRLARIALNG